MNAYNDNLLTQSYALIENLRLREKELSLQERENGMNQNDNFNKHLSLNMLKRLWTSLMTFLVSLQKPLKRLYQLLLLLLKKAVQLLQQLLETDIRLCRYFLWLLFAWLVFRFVYAVVLGAYGLYNIVVVGGHMLNKIHLH